jgi:choline/glycine/proline betaine transport protein
MDRTITANWLISSTFFNPSNLIVTKPAFGHSFPLVFDKFDALDFLKDIAIPALNELKDVLVTKGLEVELRRQDENHYVEIVVKHLKVENFVYGIKMRSFVVPDYVVDEHEKYYRAEVFLISGGQNYDVYGHTSDQIISDAITQYEKHYHFLHTTNAECV